MSEVGQDPMAAQGFRVDVLTAFPNQSLVV